MTKFYIVSDNPNSAVFVNENDFSALKETNNDNNNFRFISLSRSNSKKLEKSGYKSGNEFPIEIFNEVYQVPEDLKNEISTIKEKIKQEKKELKDLIKNEKKAVKKGIDDFFTANIDNIIQRKHDSDRDKYTDKVEKITREFDGKEYYVSYIDKGLNFSELLVASINWIDNTFTVFADKAKKNPHLEYYPAEQVLNAEAIKRAMYQEINSIMTGQ